MAIRILAVLLLASAAHAEYACHWSPMYTNDTQALHLYCTNERGFVLPVTATVEATAGNRALRTVTGKPDPKHHLMPAPIEDIRTYRVTRITLTVEGRQYVTDKPEQNFRVGST